MTKSSARPKPLGPRRVLAAERQEILCPANRLAHPAQQFFQVVVVFDKIEGGWPRVGVQLWLWITVARTTTPLQARCFIYTFVLP